VRRAAEQLRSHDAMNLTTTSLRSANRPRTAGGRAHPLPEGEGRGEGEGKARSIKSIKATAELTFWIWLILCLLFALQADAQNPTPVYNLRHTNSVRATNWIMVVTHPGQTNGNAAIQAEDLLTSMLTFPSFVGGAATNAVSSVYKDGSVVAAAATRINFITGTNTALNLTNTAGVVDVQISASASASAAGLTNNNADNVNLAASLRTAGKGTNVGHFRAESSVYVADIQTNAGAALRLRGNSNPVLEITSIGLPQTLFMDSQGVGTRSGGGQPYLVLRPEETSAFEITTTNMRPVNAVTAGLGDVSRPFESANINKGTFVNVIATSVTAATFTNSTLPTNAFMWIGAGGIMSTGKIGSGLALAADGTLSATGVAGDLNAVSNAIVAILVANDTTTSNGLFSVETTRNAAVSNSVVSLLVANDTTTSNGLFSILVANDTTTSNGLFSVETTRNAAVSNALVSGLQSVSNPPHTLLGTGAITKAVNGATNLAAGLVGLLGPTNNGNVRVKTIAPGSNITLTDQGTNVSIAASGSAITYTALPTSGVVGGAQQGYSTNLTANTMVVVSNPTADAHYFVDVHTAGFVASISNYQAIYFRDAGRGGISQFPTNGSSTLEAWVDSVSGWTNGILHGPESTLRADGNCLQFLTNYLTLTITLTNTCTGNTVTNWGLTNGTFIGLVGNGGTAVKTVTAGSNVTVTDRGTNLLIAASSATVDGNLSTLTVTNSVLFPTRIIQAGTNGIAIADYSAGYSFHLLLVTNTTLKLSNIVDGIVNAPLQVTQGTNGQFTLTITNLNGLVRTNGSYAVTTNVYGTDKLLIDANFGTNAIISLLPAPTRAGLIYQSLALFTNLNALGVMTNLGNATVTAHTMTNSGDMIRAEWRGTMPLAAVNSNQFQIVFGSQTILDTGFQTASNSVFRASVEITRSGNTSQHCDARFEWGPGNGVPFAFTNANLELSQTNGIDTTLALKGGSLRLGAHTNNSVRVWYFPAP